MATGNHHSDSDRARHTLFDEKIEPFFGKNTVSLTSNGNI